ncbi:MAG: hypothetical protein ACK53A_07025 [Gemmatimonadota bacterium]|jgi:hypothetical protein|nr:hypothetical protein [Gemmatimonadota bacterium]
MSIDLLTNAVESIQVGVEDYSAATRPRLLSAVRNIHAGILLLFKEALRRRSPADSNEVLVKSRVQPEQGTAGEVRFVGVGRKTADTSAIRKRFEALGIKTDWKRVERIAEVRNDIEHYYPHLTQPTIRELVASAFWLVRDFMTRELATDPATALGQRTWSTMLEVADVWQEERTACDAALAAVAWESDALSRGVRSMKCLSCGASLFRPIDATVDTEDLMLRCTVCATELRTEQFAQAAIAAAFEWESYVAMKDGGDSPFGECPECGLETYVFEEDGCAYCGATFGHPDCARCGKRIPLSEAGCAPLCSYCHYVMSKDD